MPQCRTAPSTLEQPMTKKNGLLNITVERLEREDTGLDEAVIGFDKTGGRGKGELTVSMQIMDDAITLRRKLLSAGAPVGNMEAAQLKAELVARLPDNAGKLFTTGGWKKLGDQPVFVPRATHHGCGR